MNIGVLVVLVVAAWSALSVMVALVVGGMARARDDGPIPVVDQRAGAGRMRAVHDEDIRAAV